MNAHTHRSAYTHLTIEYTIQVISRSCNILDMADGVGVEWMQVHSSKNLSLTGCHLKGAQLSFYILSCHRTS